MVCMCETERGSIIAAEPQNSQFRIISLRLQSRRLKQFTFVSLSHTLGESEDADYSGIFCQFCCGSREREELKKKDKKQRGRQRKVWMDEKEEGKEKKPHACTHTRSEPVLSHASRRHFFPLWPGGKWKTRRTLPNRAAVVLGVEQTELQLWYIHCD